MRLWVALSAGLVIAGLGVALFKVVALDYPLRPAEQTGTWRVGLTLAVEPGPRRTVVEGPLPRSLSYQRLIAEEVRSGPMRFSIKGAGGNRTARWSGKVEARTVVSYETTVVVVPNRRPVPARETDPEYSRTMAAALSASAMVQSRDPAVVQLSRELRLDGSEKVKLARDIFAFVGKEIGVVRARAGMDAVTVIREGRGTVRGRSRLFCALARANGLPCRVVTGVFLSGHQLGSLHYWNDVPLGDAWVPIDASEHHFGSLPADRLVLSTEDEAAFRSAGSRAFSYRFDIQPEIDAYTDLVRRRLAESERPLDRLSLLLLPVQTQSTLRILLLVPLGALVMCVVRNVIGIRTFGMFMPMLIALAMTSTGPLWGTAFLLLIVGAALLSRQWLRGLYLLLAARVAFVLTLVVLLMTVLIVLGHQAGLPAAAGVGAFPFVIMTMLVERISVSLEEEGVANTVRRAASTILAVYLTYAVIEWRTLQSLLVIYPELLLCILGLLIALGRYTGYRLTELFRFRDIRVGEP